MFGNIGTKARPKAFPQRWESPREPQEALGEPIRGTWEDDVTSRRPQGGLVPPTVPGFSLMPRPQNPGYIYIYISHTHIYIYIYIIYTYIYIHICQSDSGNRSRGQAASSKAGTAPRINGSVSAPREVTPGTRPGLRPPASA